MKNMLRDRQRLIRDRLGLARDCEGGHEDRLKLKDYDKNMDSDEDLTTCNSNTHIFDFGRFETYDQQRNEAAKKLSDPSIALDPNKGINLELAETVSCLPVLTPDLFSQRTNSG